MSPLPGADALAKAWNASAPARYRIDAPIVDLNVLGHPLLHTEASGSRQNAFVAIKRSASELYAGPDSKLAHASLFSENSEEPIRRAIDILRAEGYAALIVGQDSGHFLPGAPTDVPWMGRLLRRFGFVPGGLSFDLENDLSTWGHHAALANESSCDFRALAQDDLPALDAFLATAFPGRWRFDVMGKVEADGAETVFGLFQGEVCLGFALLQGEGCRKPIGGAIWRNDLGPNWGSLGPIGIAESIRKAGLGTRLLHEALAELHRRGARRTIIDWTGLLDFYGAEGFSVTRAYRSYRLEL